MASIHSRDIIKAVEVRERHQSLQDKKQALVTMLAVTVIVAIGTLVALFAMSSNPLAYNILAYNSMAFGAIAFVLAVALVTAIYLT